MTDEDHEEHEETNNKSKAKLPNLDDWDETFKQLGQKAYKEIWGKPKK